MAGKGWVVDGLDLVPRVEVDEKMAPLLKVVEGRSKVYFYCGFPADVHLAIETAKINGFLDQTVLVLGGGCYKAIDEIVEAKVPVVLSPRLVYTETDPITEEETQTFEAKVFLDRGVPFALASADSGMESLWFQAALSVGQGLTREQALAAVTTAPARMIGLEGRVGVLKAGADANVVLFSGDPLSVRSQVEHVFVDGKQVYDRSKDPRLKHLFEGQRPAGTAVDEAAADAGRESVEGKESKDKDEDK
ncbi:MAG: amidohydrolase family protein [Planctomycetota bacterium]